MSADRELVCAHCDRPPGDPEGPCDWIECPVGVTSPILSSAEKLTIKPRIRYVSGEWRASEGAHHAVGATPEKAYRRLLAYMEYLQYGRRYLAR